jgi:methyltransferase (TIGR00027 family)
MRRAVGDGTAQLMLLGAGFDDCASRLPQNTRIRLFEVDQPATQQRKIRTMTRRFGKATHVVHIPIDFQTQTVDSALRTKGFDSEAPSFIVWGGVTHYLSEGAVDDTVRALSKVVAPGSRMVVQIRQPRVARRLGGICRWPSSVEARAGGWRTVDVRVRAERAPRVSG